LPAEPPDYGWSALYPESTLEVTGTGLPNQVPDGAVRANLSLMSDFLGALPFGIQVTSGYRSAPVNSAVGGSSTSQHRNGLAADIKALAGASNKDLATYFWFYRDSPGLAALDQVIWYTGKGHAHIGICPPGGSGCVAGAPRREFRVNDQGSYRAWSPSSGDLNTLGARLLIAAGPPRGKNWVLWVGFGLLGVSLAVAGAAWWWERSR
jgi:hypothetical protein